jgi:hypothetical protein
LSNSCLKLAFCSSGNLPKKSWKNRIGGQCYDPVDFCQVFIDKIGTFCKLRF